jgi:haloalkane dehalogenase
VLYPIARYPRRRFSNMRASIPSREAWPERIRPVFQAFRTPGIGWDMLVKQDLFVEQILPGGVMRKLSETNMDHYRKPFEAPGYRKPLWCWPNELPIADEPADVVRAVAPIISGSRRRN